MKNLHNRYKRYREWKLEPHQVAPLSEEQHECATCGTHYEGNYCPRCGQSARIGRYSFKKAILLFLDVWGLGNRGMFRSIRDLILRPGYMIRDYLRGMQMAYFPPFKMFFLLLTLWLVVDSGLNIQFVNRDKQNKKETEQIFSRFKPKASLNATDDKADEKKNGILFTIPDLRLSECFVAMVYITDMILIYGIIPSLLCFSVKAEQAVVGL